MEDFKIYIFVIQKKFSVQFRGNIFIVYNLHIEKKMGYFFDDFCSNSMHCPFDVL